MPDETPAVTVIVLAGGEAKRLPGKLYLDAGDLPLLVRVYRNVSSGRPTMIVEQRAVALRDRSAHRRAGRRRPLADARSALGLAHRR